MNGDRKRLWRFAVRGLVVSAVLTLALLLFLSLRPASVTVPSPSQRIWCKNNLHMLGIALCRYHDLYGSFPPTYVADAEGKALYSWRVLLLPWLDYGPVYDSFDRLERWDGPRNRELPGWWIERLVCPSLSSDDCAVASPTNYLAVVGPGTAWQGTTPVRLPDIEDPLSETILLVEVPASNIPWSKPFELDVTAFLRGETNDCSLILSSRHYKPKRFWREGIPRGACVLFADGSVRYLPDSIPAEHLRAVLTIAGGERLPADKGG